MSRTLDQVLQEREDYRSILALTDEVLHYIERVARGEVEVPLQGDVYKRADVSLIDPIRDVLLEFRLEAEANLESINNTRVVTGD